MVWDLPDCLGICWILRICWIVNGFAGLLGDLPDCSRILRIVRGCAGLFKIRAYEFGSPFKFDFCGLFSCSVNWRKRNFPFLFLSWHGNIKESLSHR